MTKWEYTIERNAHNDLWRFGAEGWELITVIVTDGGRLYYFKRPLQ